MRNHSPIGNAAYHDLRRLLQDEAVSDIRGTPTRVTVKGKVFWYDKYRIGSEVAQRYIGEDTPELRARLDRFADLKAESKERAVERRRIVRLLRAEGYAPLDAQTGSLLAAFERVGVFRLGGTVVGTVAFRHYEGELGVSPGLDRLAQTGDIDLASFERLSFAIGDTVSEPLADALSELDFAPVPSLNAGHVWKWKQAGKDTLVEFLMPAQKEESVRVLPALGVSAQALRHLDFLLADPIKAVSLYRSGILIQIPRPEAFAIHKLIVADRRGAGESALKAEKDRGQADFLIEVLARDRPDELLEAYEDALSRGPKWRQRIEASLKRMPEAARRLAALD